MEQVRKPVFPELKESLAGQKNNMKRNLKGRKMGEHIIIYTRKKMPMQSAIIIVMGITGDSFYHQT
jgi:hypothetical protein